MKCPCEKCISYAICVNTKIIRCTILYKIYKSYIKQDVITDVKKGEAILRSYANFFNRDAFSISVNKEVVIFSVNAYSFVEECKS